MASPVISQAARNFVVRMPVSAGMVKAAHKGLHIEQVADGPFSQSLFYRQVVDIPPPVLMTAQMNPHFFSRLDHGAGFFLGYSQWFFTNHVLAGGHHLNGQPGMGIRRGGNDYKVDCRIGSECIRRLVSFQLRKILLRLLQAFGV